METPIEYPYMPEDRHLKYVPHDHPFMREACRARAECAGDPIWPVGIVAVRDGEVVARAGNGFNRGPQEVHVCPRIVNECASGEGYDLCDLHDSPGHSEAMLVKVCKEAGIETEGLDAYMYGHWWACEPCWKALIDAGFRDLYVTDDAHERFTKDKVYGETLKPSVRSAYITGSLSGLTEDDLAAQKDLYEAFGSACEEMGCEISIPHMHSDNIGQYDASEEFTSWAAEKIPDHDVTVAEVSNFSFGLAGELLASQAAGNHIVLMSRKDSNAAQHAKGNPAVVYHIEYESVEDAVRMLKNVLKHL